MVYFETGDTKLKLIILYFMYQANFEMTQDQLFYALAENGWMEFFDFKTTFHQLEEGEYVECRARSFGRAYSLSASGKEAVELFSESLPESFRLSADRYLRDYGEEMRKQNQFSMRMTNLPGGGQQVRLRALDENAVLMEISLRLPDKNSAQKACDRWPDEAPALYRYILQELIIKEPEKKEPEQ